MKKLLASALAATFLFGVVGSSLAMPGQDKDKKPAAATMDKKPAKAHKKALKKAHKKAAKKMAAAAKKK